VWYNDPGFLTKPETAGVAAVLNFGICPKFVAISYYRIVSFLSLAEIIYITF
jgi:hypothetical protein